jgi:hypothetical protein
VKKNKILALPGWGYSKAVTLNLLKQAHTSSYIAAQDGKGSLQVSNLEEGVSVLAREYL